jgi:glycosyltransferase involved in cell wall biosynthesis
VADPTFVLLSFEGPDRYSHAGGLGTRVAGIADALARAGHRTHVFFIGDPELPGHEVSADGLLHFHRWCQWISRHHASGVYDGEEAKLEDWTRSIPAWIEAKLLRPAVEGHRQVVVMAEEWHTAASVIALGGLVRRNGWGKYVRILWNANNTFGFDRIDWPALDAAATITTVSRYMKLVMGRHGVNPRVIPNGIPESWLAPVERASAHRLQKAVSGRVLLAKVARWDPDKRWEMAVDAVAWTRRVVGAPLFLARGGSGEYGQAIAARARAQGLTVANARLQGDGPDDLIDAVVSSVQADMVLLDGYLTEAQRRMLFHVADAVLANSGVEPFGLVGLETMAVGGVAFVGCTGEDYVTPGYDAVSLQSNDPMEIVHHVNALVSEPETARQMRHSARTSAARYTWPAVLDRVLLPHLAELGSEVQNGGRIITAARRPDVLPTPTVQGSRVATEGLAAARAKRHEVLVR